MFRTDRYCKQTTVINGVTIPKGATIDVPINLLHHSPLYWKDPEKFNPDRFSLYLYTHMLASFPGPFFQEGPGTRLLTCILWPSRRDCIDSTQAIYYAAAAAHFVDANYS